MVGLTHIRCSSNMITGKKFNILFCSLLIIWMAFIFIMSMQPAEQSSQLSGGIVSKLIAALFHDFKSLALQQQKHQTTDTPYQAQSIDVFHH